MAEPQVFEPSPPSPLVSALELPRTVSEAMSLLCTWSQLDRLPNGDGHPIMVLPGFMGGDDSTWFLRRFLIRHRYRALPWTLGTNTGEEEVQERLVRRVFRLIRTYREPITLIGQSLGGVFAREMARRFPNDIRQVVTLGSPFGATDAGSTNPMVLRLFEQLSGLSVDEMRSQMVHDTDPTEPVGVPCTAIYSKTDGVVQWQTCLEHDTPLTENIEVIGSHTGMAFNPVIYALLTERLAQPLHEWKKFDRHSWPWISMLLPPSGSPV